MKRIVVPVDDENGLEARLADHFVDAPYYAIVDIDENSKITNVKTELNKEVEAGCIGRPHENLLVLNPTVFVVRHMGPVCLASLQDAGIKVLKANGKTVKKIVASYIKGKLKQIEQIVPGCERNRP